MSATRHRRKCISGFEVHTLANAGVSVSMVPELGGRIVSLRDRTAKREWLDGWMPSAKRRLWHPADPADFGSGPGAGIDECLPTVLPCKLGSRALPDHGELWNARAGFDADLAADGILSSRWNLRSLPLAFERRISLNERGAVLNYRLENMADEPTPFLWAWHPLFALKHGDEIRFDRSVTDCLTGDGKRHPWPEHEAGCDLSRALFPKDAVQAAKVFVGPMVEGIAEIRAAGGACLTLAWPAELFPFAGIWITRGFWKGLHHWAIEPTNAPVDRLSDISESSAQSMLQPCEIRNWTLTIGVQSIRSKTSDDRMNPLLSEPTNHCNS